MNQFFVTLPSSASAKINPNNKVTHYNVYLGQNLHLEDENYEVGLAEIHLRGDLENVLKRKHALKLTFEITENEYKVIKRIPHVKKDSKEKATHYYPATEEHWRRIIKVNSACFFTVDIFILPNIYISRNAILETINSSFKKADVDVQIKIKNSQLQIFGSAIQDRKYEVTATPFFRTFFISEKWATESLNILSTINPTFKLENTFQVPFVDHYEIFIYSDICRHSLVGGTSSRLLRVITIPTNSSSFTFSKIFDFPHYIPISSNHVNNINVELCTLTGSYYPIITGHCILKLHFRKI